MHAVDAVTIKLTARGIDDYCRDLARRAPTLEKRVAAIDALITFIATQTDTGEQAKAEFLAIRKILAGHFEQAREALLEERTGRLREALSSRRPSRIAILYGSVSRDAFWDLLRRVEQRCDPLEVEACRRWAHEWLIDIKCQAGSGLYPDAIDFNATGVDAAEYLAMTDIGRYFGVGG